MSGARAGGEIRMDRSRVGVDLELAAGHSLEPVGRLVAAGMAGRLGLTVDRILRLERAVDVTLREPSATRARTLRMCEADGSLEVALGPLDVNRARAFELERVLSPLVDDVATRHGGPDEVWVDLRLPLDPGRGAS